MIAIIKLIWRVVGGVSTYIHGHVPPVVKKMSINSHFRPRRTRQSALWLPARQANRSVKRVLEEQRGLKSAKKRKEHSPRYSDDDRVHSFSV